MIHTFVHRYYMLRNEHFRSNMNVNCCINIPRETYANVTRKSNKRPAYVQTNYIQCS